MTLRHFFMLEGAGSSFLSKQPVTPEDIGVLLWILSPEYKACPKARDEFCKKIAKLDIQKTLQDITQYFDLTFSDADTDESEKKVYASFVGYCIDLFAHEYGWTIDMVMDMPMRRIYQLSSVIAERYARQNGKKYTKLRNIDMLEAKALLDEVKKQKETAKT